MDPDQVEDAGCRWPAICEQGPADLPVARTNCKPPGDQWWIWFSKIRRFTLRRKLIFFVFEKQIKSGKRTITPGDILLHFDLFTIRQSGVAINFLFQNPQLIP